MGPGKQGFPVLIQTHTQGLSLSSAHCQVLHSCSVPCLVEILSSCLRISLAVCSYSLRNPQYLLFGSFFSSRPQSLLLKGIRLKLGEPGISTFVYTSISLFLFWYNPQICLTFLFRRPSVLPSLKNKTFSLLRCRTVGHPAAHSG